MNQTGDNRKGWPILLSNDLAPCKNLQGYVTSVGDQCSMLSWQIEQSAVFNQKCTQTIQIPHSKESSGHTG